MRALKVERGGKLPPGGVTVWLRGGRYELARTFVLGPEDSGQDGAPVVYRAYPGELPILSGGRVIRGWRKVTEDLPGLPAAARGKVWAAEIPAARDGKWLFRQPWKNGQRLTRARWPNEEMAPFRVADASLPSAETLRNPAAIEQWKRTVRQAWRIVEFRDAAVFPSGRLPVDLANGSAELLCRNGGRWATIRIPVAAAEGTRLRLVEPAGLLSHYWGDMRLMSAYCQHAHRRRLRRERRGHRRSGPACPPPRRMTRSASPGVDWQCSRADSVYPVPIVRVDVRENVAPSSLLVDASENAYRFDFADSGSSIDVVVGEGKTWVGGDPTGGDPPQSIYWSKDPNHKNWMGSNSQTPNLPFADGDAVIFNSNVRVYRHWRH